MKKIVCILAAVFFMTASSYGQQDTISWLTSETKDNSFGNRSAATLGAFMEFYEEDIFDFKGQAKQIDSITEIIFSIDSNSLPNISSCKVIIKQGKDIYTANEVASQIIPIGDLVGDWNVVKLKTPYKVDPSLRLYIGYQVEITNSAYPVNVSNGTAPKQAWLLSGSNFINLINETNYKNNFLIKAVTTTKTSPVNEISMISVDLDSYILIGDSIQIKGKVKNMGTSPIISFKLAFESDGLFSDTNEINGLNIKSMGTYSFTHTQYFTPTNPKIYTIRAIVMEPNGIIDVETNNELSTSIRVYNEIIDRVVLHEVFTSSTCPPCKSGNEKLDKVLNSVDSTRWACVKYQYYFPSTGDPYFIAECEVRGNFYGGVGSVPTFFGDGTFSKNPSSYTVNEFNALAAVPAAAAITGTSTMDEINYRTITLNTTIVPTCDLTSNNNLRFFAAIVEKRTMKNITTNGEKEFHYVLKKFMSDVNGDEITGLTLNAQKQVDYRYTFNGNYRLPANAGNPINHATEHSVEIFKNLMVVYWLQDIVTKEVYQAGKAEPYKGTIVNIIDRETQNVAISVFPNPATNQLNIQSNISFSKISIVNMLGQTIKTVEVGAENHVMDVSDMAKGLYILKVDTPQGSTTKKIQIK